jgi:hypothetical protein
MMTTPRKLTTALNREEGHLMPFVASLIGGAGALGVGIGAATDAGWLSVAAGVVALLGITAAGTVRHRTIDWELFGRIEKLEGKQ